MEDDSIVILSTKKTIVKDKKENVCNITDDANYTQKVSLLCPYAKHRLVDPVIPDCCTEKHPFKTVCTKCIEGFKLSNKTLKCPFCGVGVSKNDMVGQTQIQEAILKTKNDIEFVWSKEAFGITHLFLDENGNNAIDIPIFKVFFPIPKQKPPTTIPKEKPVIIQKENENLIFALEREVNNIKLVVFDIEKDPNPDFLKLMRKTELVNKLEKYKKQIENLSKPENNIERWAIPLETPIRKTQTTRTKRSQTGSSMIISYRKYLHKLIERTEKNLKDIKSYGRDTGDIEHFLDFLESQSTDYKNEFKSFWTP